LFFAQVGLKDAEAKKLMEKAETYGLTSRQFVAKVLRQALAEETSPNTETSPAAAAPKLEDSDTELTLEMVPSRTAFTGSPPLTLTNGPRKTNLTDTKPVAEKDWKKWTAQRDLLWHFHLANPGGDRINAVREYHAMELELMGEKAHTVAAANQELYRLTGTYDKSSQPLPYLRHDLPQPAADGLREVLSGHGRRPAYPILGTRLGRGA
jgi:hypothetical protein